MPMTSLHHKLTLPVLLVVVSMVGLHFWLLYEQFSREMQQQYLLRGQVLLKSINYSLENTHRSQDILRIVQAFGAEADVQNVVLAVGNPPQIIAANRMDWIGRPVEDLPEEFRNDLNLVLTQRREIAHFIENQEKPLHMGRMVVLILNDLQPPLNRGALLVHLDASNLYRQLRDIQYAMFGTLAILTMGSILLIWLVLQRAVFRPVHQLTTAMARRAKGDTTAFIPRPSQDEIGQVAAAYNDMLTALAAHESAIVAEKERAELFLETSGAVVVGLDNQGRVTLINQWGCRLLGYRQEELIGKDWFDMAMAEPRRQYARQLFQESFDKQPADAIELEIRPRFQPPRTLSWNYRVMRDHGGNATGLLASGMDISRRIMAEHALRDSEELFRNSFENAPFGMCLVGLDQKIIKVNLAFCRLAATPAGQLVGEAFQDVLTGGDKSFPHLPVNPTATLEMRFQHPAGAARWAAVGFSLVQDARGNKRFFVVQVQDITDRIAAKAEILHRMSVEKAVSLASQDLVSRRDPYYTILLSHLAQAIEADRACVFRLSGEGGMPQILGNWFSSESPPCRCHVPDNSNFDWLLTRFTTGHFGGGLMVDDVLELPADREERNFLLSRQASSWFCLPIRYSKGELEGFIIFDRVGEARPWRPEDIAAIQVATDMLGSHWERLATEDEKLLMQERAMRTAHLASLGMLSAGVAHEINNPNNLIMFNAPLLKKIWDGVVPILQEKQRQEGEYTLGGLPVEQVVASVPRLLSAIQDGTQRIQRIVSQLKRLVRSDQGGREEPVELAKLVHDALSIISLQFHKRSCVLRVHVPDDLPMVRGSVQELEQVFLNVAMNAIESLQEINRGIWIQAVVEGDGVVLSVRDEGVGIAPELLAKVTDPLFTTKGETGGTGLGLAISKGILDKYGGRLELASEVGKGTTVRIILPVFKDSANS